MTAQPNEQRRHTPLRQQKEDPARAGSLLRQEGDHLLAAAVLVEEELVLHLAGRVDRSGL